VSAEPSHPQLDGLRAVAVFGVLCTHLLPSQPWVRRVGPGGLGVVLFFVLSGFLITGILLRLRDALAGGRVTRGRALSRFYLRRALRIFPLYYAVLAVTAIADIPPVRATFGWHALYLSNLYFARRGSWNGPVTPLWSLSVEEQFYLLWPLVVLFLPRRHFFRALLALIALGPLVRAGYLLAGVDPFAIGLLPVGCADTLLLGALLALCWHEPARFDGVRLRVRRFGVAVALPAVALYLALGPVPAASPWFVLAAALQLALTGAAFFALIDAAARGLGGPLGAALASRPMRFLGQISYGIYLMHTVLQGAARGFGDPWRALYRDELAWFPVACATVVAVASATWVLFERPINSLKRRFPYVG
jgi:peptidoglycan/LPS O-acetylase OafA/YrhL